MIKFKKVGLGLSAIVLTIGVSILAQTYINVNATETITGNDNEIINIKTTDGVPITASAMDYSSDGNVILFRSGATNLPDAGSSTYGLYIYNIKEDTTQRVDISTAGVPADNSPHTRRTTDAKISETGRYVIFLSSASNLIDGSVKTAPLYYKRDTQLGVTTFAANATSPVKTSKNWDYNLGISSDGRFSLMSSRYIVGSYPYPFKIILGDSATGSYAWTSLADNGYGEPEGTNTTDKNAGGMSCDGSFAVYVHQGKVNIVDLRRNTNSVIAIGNHNSISPIISCNGRYILYSTTDRTDITPTPIDMDNNHHLVRYDRITEERMYIGDNSSGIFDVGYSIPWNFSPAANPFNATVADTGDVVFKYGDYMYIKHLSDGSGTFESIAKDVNGTPVSVNNGRLSGNGQYVLFNTDPYNLGLTPSPSTTQIIRAKTNL